MQTTPFMVFLIFFIIIITITSITKNKVVYMKSDIDNHEYMINSDSETKVANILASLREKMNYFKNKLNEDNEQDIDLKEAIIRLKKNFTDKTEITETALNSGNTSYTINKGEKISFCVRSKKTGEHHDINLLTYVALHELSHIACKEANHTKLFWKIFEYFIKKGIEYELYKKIEFENNPVEYCGMSISNSII